MSRVPSLAAAHINGFCRPCICYALRFRVQKDHHVRNAACQATRASDATSNITASSLTPSADATSASEDAPRFFKDDTGALAHSLRRPDGIQLYVRQYNVSSSIQARGVVVLVHGWTWHSGYFAPFAHYLTDNGFNVVTFDHRSHGLSECVDGIRGCVQDVDDFAKDTIAIMDFAQQQNTGLPCFAWGESMGAQMILRALTEFKQAAALKALKGFVISGTPVKIPKNLVPPRPVFLALAALGKSLYGDNDIKTEIQYAREMYNDSVSADKQFQVYEGARHQLLQDKPEITQAVMKDSLEWLAQHLD